MNKDLYNWIALALVLIVFAAAIFIYRPVEGNLTRVTVLGESTAKVDPDTAVITFAVVTQARQAVDAQQQNAQKSEAVSEAIKRATLDTVADIKTSNYNLSPEQDYYSGKMPKILGYEVKNTVTVSVASLDKVGAIIDAATAAGANSVEGIQFVVGQESPAQGEALSLAATQAMAKAEAIAASLNGKIVRVVQTTEGGIDPVHVQASYEGFAANAAADASARRATPITAGSVELRSHVILIVDIEIPK
ncbi:hypothetical protein BH24ACI3_BH24ACI3_07770 [soil metagenome]